MKSKVLSCCILIDFKLIIFKMTDFVSDKTNAADYIFDWENNMFILCNPKCECSFCYDFSKYCKINPTIPGR